MVKMLECGSFVDVQGMVKCSGVKYIRFKLQEWISRKL